MINADHPSTRHQVDGWPTVSYLAAMNFQQSDALAARVVAGLQAQIQAHQRRYGATSNSAVIETTTGVVGDRGPGGGESAADGVSLSWHDFNLLLVVAQCRGGDVCGGGRGRHNGKQRGFRLLTDVLLCCARQPANGPAGMESDLIRAEAQLRLVGGGLVFLSPLFMYPPIYLWIDRDRPTD